MSDADSVWPGKTDDEVIEAGDTLSEYTEEGEQIIRAELRRRGLAEPPPGIGHCGGCGRTLNANDPGEQCAQCGEPFPAEMLLKMQSSESTQDHEAPLGGAGGDDDLVPVATFATLIEASLARSALDAAGIPSVVPAEQPGGRSSDRPWIDLIVRQRDRDEAIRFLKEAGHQ